MEAERKERLESARLEIARREVELELREAEAERRIAEADRLAQEALREADDYLEEESYGSRIIYRGGGLWGSSNWCRDSRWDCQYPVPYRWYDRKTYNPYYNKKRHHRTPYQQYLYVKKHYGPQRHKKKDSGHRYRNKNRYRHNGKYSSHRNLSNPTTTYYRANRIRPGSGRFNAHVSFSRGRLGSGMRR
jgi:DNA polymerase sigma